MDYKKNAVGLAGIAAGIIAICTAVWPAWIGEVSQSDNRTMVQSAADKEKSFWESFFSKTGSEKNVEPISEPTAIDWKKIFKIAATFGGFLAVVLGILSFSSREDIRISGSAIVLGSWAIAVDHLIMVIVAIGLAFIISLVLSKLHAGTD